MINSLMNMLTPFGVGFLAYPVVSYVAKPVAYKLWDDVKALWAVVMNKEQSAVKSILPNG